MKPIPIDARDVAKQLTMTVDLKVVHMREVRWRIALGICLLRIALWILPINTEIEEA